MIEFFIALIRGIIILVNRAFFRLVVRPRLIVLLKRNSSYYGSLVHDRRSFERKVWDFVRDNEFIGRDGVIVSFKIKVLVAAHAVQLSLNLPEEAYNFYDKIILYRDYYRSRITGQLHKAEVNPGLKVIVFSVRAIRESIANENDGQNVLLHEFAHALWLEHKLMGDRYAVFNDDVFHQVMEIIDIEFGRHQQNEDHFFRKYAFANKTEFFAVAVENFFERSSQFEKELPDLYRLLTRLMKQDPLRLSSPLSI
jgi:MtfA peptidase